MSGEQAGKAIARAARPKGRLSAGLINATTTAIFGATGTNGARISFQAGRLVVDPGTAAQVALPFCRLSVSQARGTVTMRTGYILHGQTMVTVNSAEVSVAGGTREAPTFVACRYTIGGVAVYLPASVTPWPLPTATTYEFPVLEVFREQGKIRTGLQLHQGILHLAGIYT